MLAMSESTSHATVSCIIFHTKKCCGVYTHGCYYSRNIKYTILMKSYKDSARLHFAINHQKIKPRISSRELLCIFFQSLSHPFATHNLLHAFQIQSEIWLRSVKLVCKVECCQCYKVLTAGIGFPQNLVQFNFVSYFSVFIFWIFHCLWASKDIRWNRDSSKYWFFFAGGEKHC